MFHIKIALKPSPIDGTGLFADEDLSADQLIYTVNDNLDLHLSEDEFKKLSEAEKKNILHYGFFDKIEKRYHLSHDNIRFTNHSNSGNMTLKDDKLFAKTNIKKGEELTQNYSEFEDLRNLTPSHSPKVKLGGIIIGVRSIKVALPFYKNVFGIVVKEQSENYLASAFNGVLLEIEEDSPNRMKKWAKHNIGTYKNTEIEVTDINAFCKSVIENGGTIISDPVARPWGTYGAEIADPDGNIFQIQEDKIIN